MFGRKDHNRSCKCGLTEKQHSQAAKLFIVNLLKEGKLDAYDYIFALEIPQSMVINMRADDLMDAIKVRLADLSRAIDQANGRYQ